MNHTSYYRSNKKQNPWPRSPPFSLVLGGINFSRGIVQNREPGFKKNNTCEFLKNLRYNRQTLLLNLVTWGLIYGDTD